jgi:hypothetical protein
LHDYTDHRILEGSGSKEEEIQMKEGNVNSIRDAAPFLTAELIAEQGKNDRELLTHKVEICPK